jgi:cobalt/nickel transport system permease protein
MNLLLDMPLPAENLDGFFQRLHTGVKLGAAFIYIVTVMSFDRHVLGRLTPFLLYPVVIGVSAAVPLLVSAKRLLPALPFCVFAGLSNVLFEREPAFTVMGITFSYGVLSCFSLIFRAVLCVEALILLTATTTVHEITAQLRRFGLPSFLTMLFEMMYRYTGVLTAEARSLRIAYTLRALRGRGLGGVDIRHTGSFIGSLFLRSMARAEHIGNALKLRGYGDAPLRIARKPLKACDVAFLGTVCFSCALFRFIDIPFFIGTLWYGLFM